MGFKNARNKFKDKADENKKIEESIKNTTHDENIAKSTEEDAKEKEKFNKSYKNILCIDDMDDGDGENETIGWLKQWLAKDEDYTGIELVKTIWEAVTKIKNCNKYDFVIFDMDLKESFDDESKKNAEEIEKIFIEHNINFSYDEINKNPKTAGIYLYLLLLSKGYPIDRMLIHSRNSTESSLKDEVENKLSYFTFDFSNKDSNTFHEKVKNSLNLEKYFEKGSYYRVRRLVFQACDYWKKNIPETEKIKFNDIYFKNKKSNQIEKESFIDMLDRTEMLFPVVKPIECEKIYYQALQVATMYHEQSAEIKEIKEKKGLRNFHYVSRYFRNFSAHSKFKEKIISADEFALIFCITLRTYFDDTNFSNEFLPYEKNYFGNDEPPEILDYIKIIHKWQNKLINKTKINDNNKMPTDVSIEQLIMHIGYQTEKILEPKDIMLVLFNDIIQNATNENKKKIPPDFVKPIIDKKSHKIEFKYSINYATVEMDNEKFFIKYAHQLITK